MPQEKHILEEARNIARNAPVWPGDTLDHQTAKECHRRGWAKRNADGDWVPTSSCPFQIAAAPQPEQQDAMLERRDAVEAFDEALDLLIPDDANTNTFAYHMALPLLQKVRQALSRTSDEGTGCVVPEAVRRLPEHLEAVSRKYGRNLMPQAANAFHDAANEARDFIDRAIAQQGGQRVLELDQAALLERVAQITAHRACCGTEHDPENGKLHGYCVVCGIPWPCEFAAPQSDQEGE